MLLPSPIQATTLPFPPAEALPDGEQVGQHLAGMQQVGEAVDDRDRGVAGQLLDVRVVEGADHDAVEVAREHPRGVPDRLAPAELDVAATRGRGRGRRAGRRRPRTTRGFGCCSWRRSSPASSRPAASRDTSPALHAGGQVEEGGQLGASEVGNGEEVARGDSWRAYCSRHSAGYGSPTLRRIRLKRRSPRRRSRRGSSSRYTSDPA